MFEFAKAKMPTPILNTPDFREVFGGPDGRSLPLDSQGLLRPVETVALKETKFKILERCGSFIYRIKTVDYPGDNLFVDMRFLEPCEEHAPDRKKDIPPKEKIIERLKALLGNPYIWGGNWSRGVPQMLAFYPPQKELDTKTKVIWSLQGVDCSGLLYEATDGATARNSSDLISYGKGIPIANKTPEAIQALLEPLDLIVWKGHVVVVLDSKTAIESRGGRGVVQSDLSTRLKEVMSDRKPADLYASSDPLFVVRRWHSPTQS